MPLSPAHLRKLADEIEAEETALEAERREAESKAEKDALQAKIDELEKKGEKVDELLEKLNDQPGPGGPGGEGKGGGSERSGSTPPPGPPDDDDDRPRTRDGRKSGAVYDWDVDAKGNRVPLEVPKVYSGEDEDDEVELPDDAEGWD